MEVRLLHGVLDRAEAAYGDGWKSEIADGVARGGHSGEDGVSPPADEHLGNEYNCGDEERQGGHHPADPGRRLGVALEHVVEAMRRGHLGPVVDALLL